MPEDELEAMLDASMTDTGGSYSDRPNDLATSPWGDKKKKRVKLAYMYHDRGGVWNLALICGQGTIYDEPSPYIDENGKPCCAIILQSCYVDRENRRAGIVTDMISQQDEVNKRRSKLLHMLSVRQTRSQNGAIADVAALKRELASPDGHIQYEQDPQSSVPGFDIISQSDQVAGQFALLEHTTQAIDNLGPNAALLGSLTGANSGRAIMAQQQAGMAELAPFYDAIRDWNLRVYRAVWNRIRQFWTEERWIRVTDAEDKLEFVGINVPMKNEFGQQMIDQQGQPVVENSIGQLDVDIIIDTAPDYAILQQEQFEQLTELMGKGFMQLPPDVIIRASSLRNKSELLEALKGPKDEEAQQAAMIQQQLQQQVMTLEMRMKAAEAADEEASAQQRMADADYKRAQTAALGTSAQIDAQKTMAGMENDRARVQIDHARLENDRVKTATDAQVKVAQLFKPAGNRQ
jgi:hypothetical protein